MKQTVLEIFKITARYVGLAVFVVLWLMLCEMNQESQAFDSCGKNWTLDTDNDH